ncbi:MAG: ABC transporter permease [Treponemataceae bacterium]
MKAKIAVYILLTIVAFVFLGPLFWKVDQNEINLNYINTPPNAIHPLGTDELGRDVLARLMAGGRISLFVGAVATIVQLALGLFFGILAAILPERLQNILMRFIDAIMTIPFYILAVSIAGFVGPSIKNLIIIIAVFTWAPCARMVRTEILRIKNEEFIMYAKLLKQDTVKITVKHFIPNIKHLLFTRATLSMAQAIMMEASLSFLNLGVRQPNASWGNMLTGAINIVTIAVHRHLWLPAALLIFLTVMSINIISRSIEQNENYA